jgi:hypothetical protein
MLAFPVDKYLGASGVVGKIISPRQGTATNRGAGPRSIIRTREPGHIVLVQGAMGASHLRNLIEQCGGNGKDREYRELLQFHFRSSGVFATGKLPSRRVPFATIRFITLGSFVQHGKRLPVPISDAVRSTIAAQLREHHTECLAGERNGYECFRAISTHGRSFFTVEQQATFFTLDCGRDRPWSGVLLSDVGERDSTPPWTTKRQNFEQAQFLTVGSSDLNAVRRPHGRDATNRDGGEAGSRLLTHPDPFTSRLHDDGVMSGVSRELCVRYPFPFVADLFETSALCWDQALNFLSDALQHLPADHGERVKILGEAKRLIDRATRYFGETLQFIDARGRSHWPRPGGEDQARVDVMAQRLRNDFAALADEAARLSTVCQETADSTVTEVNILAGQQALDESRRMYLFTYLAFIFIPLSLVSSIFGMNVDVLGDPGAPIWIPIAVGVGVLIPSMFVAVYLGSPRVRGWCRRPVLWGKERKMGRN